MPSEQQADGAPHAIAQMIKHGPPDGVGILRWLVGMWLWWRAWAMALLAITPFVVGWNALEYTNPGGAVFVAALVGLFVGKWIIRVSPKYELTENY